MQYRAEIFDQMQLLFHETGFHDHQVHCVIYLDSGLDEAVLEKAVLLSLEAIPILATRYRVEAGRARWEALSAIELARAFTATEDRAAFESQTTYRIREEIGPQLRLCLLRASRSALSVTMNHMVADGAGFKDYLYFLCEIYSRLSEDPSYRPRKTLTGDRGLRVIWRAIGPWARARAWLSAQGDSNRSGTLAFPLQAGHDLRPFMATRVIGREKVARMREFCKARGATLNDAVLAAYYRSLARRIGPAALEGLTVPIMIDMRRYLPKKEFGALRNFASTSITRLRQREGEAFEATLLKATALMNELKRRRMGLAAFMKVSLLYALLGERAARWVLRRRIRNPLICMTNIGDIDSRRLSFGPSSVASAFLCGAIKYKPHFQLALSGFDGTITLSCNLYGSADDRERVDAFLREVEEELSV
jgi:NRPS condensation-like uncharacterized protein